MVGVFKGKLEVVCGSVTGGSCDELLTTDYYQSQILIRKILRTISIPVTWRNIAVAIK